MERLKAISAGRSDYLSGQVFDPYKHGAVVGSAWAGWYYDGWQDARDGYNAFSGVVAE